MIGAKNASVLACLMAAVLTTLGPPAAAASPPIRMEHLRLSAFVDSQWIAPGGKVLAALRLRLAPGWHIYWRNPGQIGQPTSVTWSLPQGWRARNLPWPAPRVLRTGPLTNYVYTGTVALVSQIDADPRARPGALARIAARVELLACRDVCIPETAMVPFSLHVRAGAGAHMAHSEAIAAALRAVPRQWPGTARVSLTAHHIDLRLSGFPAHMGRVEDLRFFPDSSSTVDAAGAQGIRREAADLTLALPRAQAFEPPAGAWTLRGILATSGGPAYRISAAAGPRASVTRTTAPPARPGHPKPRGWIAALILAVLGGLVLNVMPCVFPVLAMKVAALLNDRQNIRQMRNEAAAYWVGTTVSFLALAVLLLAVRAGGRVIGWGFQLQSPTFVALVTLVILTAGLNLSGVMELGTSLQSVGSGWEPRSRLLGSLLAGALAVFVAAPCMVPFMAPAVGWALTQPAARSLSVFCALGVGLGIPPMLATLLPRSWRLLPRPGRWMVTFRQLLAFPMYASAAWLVWVFTAETGPGPAFELLLAATGVGFAAWLWDKAAREWSLAVVKAAAVAAFLGSAAFAAHAAQGTPGARVSKAEAGAVQSQRWSPRRVARLRARHRPVLVDFTAAWCLTCKVNELTVLDSEPVRQALRETHTAYLRADWTRGDPRITAALARFGRSGVPLYLLYGASRRPVVLPQLLDRAGVISDLRRAARAIASGSGEPRGGSRSTL